MSKTFLLLSMLCFCCYDSMSQASQEIKTMKNTVYAELNTWTIASSLTINYEPELFRSATDRFRLNGRVGLGLGLNYGSDYNTIHGGLVGATMILGAGINRFAASGGWIVAREAMNFGGDARRITPPLIELGWRYENPEKRFMSKVSAGTMGLIFGVGFTF